jgi:hypothetical protein
VTSSPRRFRATRAQRVDDDLRPPLWPFVAVVVTFLCLTAACWWLAAHLPD